MRTEVFPRGLLRRWAELGRLGAHYPVAGGGGPNIRALQTRAARGAGGWVLDGSTVFIDAARAMDHWKTR
jgi:alkylation response protein AidB-like acyl-CoA dehydrogenase